MSPPICRICGTTFNLMHVLQGGEVLLEKLRLCANIKIDFENDLPQHICLKCEQGLNFSYRLRKQGEAMELKLRQQFKKTDSIDLNDELDDIEDELKEFRVQNAKTQCKDSKAGNDGDDDDDVKVVEINEQLEGESFAKKAQDSSHMAKEEWKVTMKSKENLNIEILQNNDINFENEFISPHPDTGQKALIVSQLYLRNSNLKDNQTLTNVKMLESKDMNEKSCEIDTSKKDKNINNEGVIIIDDDDIEIVDVYQPLDERAPTTKAMTSTTSPPSKPISPTTFRQLKDIEHTKTSFDSNDMVIVRNQANSPEYLQEDEFENDQANSLQMEDYEALDAAIICQDNLENGIIEKDFQLQTEDVSKSFHSDISLEQNIGFRTFEKYSVDLVDKVEVLSEPDDNVEDDDIEAIAADLEDAVDEVEETNNELFLQPNTMNSQLLKLQNHGQLKVSIMFKCDTCLKTFNRQSEYRQHIKVHGRERFSCAECKKWFPTRYRLRQHERIHTNDIDMHVCTICANRYRHSQNLWRHMRSAHNNEEFDPNQCGVCHETFSQPDLLMKHMVTHKVERTYVCELCQRTFKTIFHLISHKRIHLPKTSEPSRSSKLKIPAPNSSTNTPTYTSTDSSSSPQHTTTPQRVYTCAYCGKISKHSFAHKNHLRTHTQERPYDCEFCVKKFRTLAAKITHERIHNDVRPYQCDRCLLSFRQASHLKEHKLIHDGVMSFVCKVCNIAFTKKSNLKVHMRIHTGERPYKCAESECGEQFAKLSQLKRHAAQAHARDVGALNDDGDDDEDEAHEEEEDDEDVDISETADGKLFHVIDDSELLGLDVSIGAEETAMETVLDNESHFNSLYILDDMNSS